MNVLRLARLCLLTHDAERLADFYTRAFDCRVLSREMFDVTAGARLPGVRGGARRVLLGLAAQRIELLQLDAVGRAYPSDVSASDVRFQHFAIVVADMTQAHAQLARVGGWQSISSHGPQHLPMSSGGVIAFKFRDPEGHPLELLTFPTAAAHSHGGRGAAGPLFVGIDHSAICVADSARSIAFYEALGLRVSARSINQGLQQQRLDGLADAHVQVVALSPRQTPPHVELLCYHIARSGDDLGSGAGALLPTDVAATRLVFESDAADAQPRQLLDPDGHHLIVC